MKKIAINRRHLKRGLGTWTTTGHWYGFPKCCVEAFSRLKHFNEDTENWPLYGTGFVPCKECATTKTAEQLTAEINAARICPIPFPHAGTCDYKRETRKENKWVLKILTGRLPFPFEEDVREQLMDEVEQLQHEDKENKVNRAARLKRISGQTARQNLITMKHRRKFIDFWSRIFQIAIPNATWAMLKGDEDVVDYRVGKTRYVIALAHEARTILARAKENGVECSWPDDLQLEQRPLHEVLGLGFRYEPLPDLNGPAITELNEQHRKFVSIFTEPLLEEQRNYLTSLVRENGIFGAIQGPVGDDSPFPKAFVIDSLGGLDAKQLKELKAPQGSPDFTFREDWEARLPSRSFLNRKLEIINLEQSPRGVKVAVTERAFDPEVVGEVTTDMILPAGIRHMRGLNFNKED